MAPMAEQTLRLRTLDGVGHRPILTGVLRPLLKVGMLQDGRRDRVDSRARTVAAEPSAVPVEGQSCSLDIEPHPRERLKLVLEVRLRVRVRVLSACGVRAVFRAVRAKASNTWMLGFNPL